MNWKLNPKTGCMEQVVSPAKEIEKALAPIGDIPEWSGIHYVKKNAIILYNRDAYLAIAFNGQWRLLGIITNMHTKTACGFPQCVAQRYANQQTRT